VTQQFIYNPLDWITERDLFKGSTTLASEIYGRDALGQVTLIDRIGTNDDRFGYYLDGEMNWASYDSTLFKDSTYTLDKAGNRTQVYDGTTWKTYTPNSTNQYTVADAVAVSNNAEHQISAFDGVTYTYYNDGRLASVSNGTTWTNFAYDAFGRLVRRIKDGWDAKYSYYDGEKELLECGVGGGAAFKNTYGKGIDEILYRLDTTNNWPLYFQQDANGNVTELTWSDGGVVEIFQYDAFGALNKTASGWGNPFLFTGRRYQSTFGIYEYRARAYSPRLGRFTGEDPKLFVRGINLGKAPDDWSFEKDPEQAEFNLFRYCGNDPLDFVDPMGTVPEGPLGPEPQVPAEDRGHYLATGGVVLAAMAAGPAGSAVESALGRVAIFLRYGGPAALAAKMGLNANKLNHIFGKPTHNLDALVKQFRTKERAGQALAQATQAVTKGRTDGIFEKLPVQVGNYKVLVNGNVIGGTPKISTAYIPNEWAIQQGIKEAEGATSSLIHSAPNPYPP